LSEDPLTGRRKHEVVWLGLKVYERTEETEVSKWADQSSVPEIYPARFGWNVITRTNRGWFTGSTIGCGGGYRIPDMIFQGQIALDGQTREATLRSYQDDSVEAYYLHGSTVGVQRRWAALPKSPTDTPRSTRVHTGWEQDAGVNTLLRLDSTIVN
jgi:hypothetical protein